MVDVLNMTSWVFQKQNKLRWLMIFNKFPGMEFKRIQNQIHKKIKIKKI